MISAIICACLASGVSYAATSWTLGPSGRSTAASPSAPITNLTVRAVIAPPAFRADLLYPGASGTVMATISNPNAFPVTITALELPSNTSYAAGYTDSALTTPRVDCTASTPSGVTWGHATSTTGSVHTLAAPITVTARSAVTVTLIDGASMALAAPPACANTYFLMPPLAGFVASAGPAAHVSVVTTDGWTR